MADLTRLQIMITYKNLILWAPISTYVQSSHFSISIYISYYNALGYTGLYIWLLWGGGAWRITLYIGHFPFNPKVRKIWLVHQMGRTISVWSDWNIWDQLWRWSTVTGLVISVGRTEMSLSICQNCCSQFRSFLSCLQDQVVSNGKWSAVSKAWHLK